MSHVRRLKFQKSLGNYSSLFYSNKKFEILFVRYNFRNKKFQNFVSFSSDFGVDFSDDIRFLGNLEHWKNYFPKNFIRVLLNSLTLTGQEKLLVVLTPEIVVIFLINTVIFGCLFCCISFKDRFYYAIELENYKTCEKDLNVLITPVLKDTVELTIKYKNIFLLLSLVAWLNRDNVKKKLAKFFVSELKKKQSILEEMEKENIVYNATVYYYSKEALLYDKHWRPILVELVQISYFLYFGCFLSLMLRFFGEFLTLEKLQTWVEYSIRPEKYSFKFYLINYVLLFVFFFVLGQFRISVAALFKELTSKSFSKPKYKEISKKDYQKVEQNSEEKLLNLINSLKPF